MKKKITMIVCALLAVVIAAGVTFGVNGYAKRAEQTTTKSQLELKTGVVTHKNKKSEIDASNIAEGFVMVRWLGGGDKRIKVQIQNGDSTKYTYNLNNKGDFETFPLSDGDGEYSVKVFENVADTKYAQAQSVKLTVKLRDQFLPFLYSNQYVNWTSDSEAAKKAAEITKNCKDDFEKVKAVFDYVTENIEYDYAFAEKVKSTKLSGYIPTVDTTMSTKKGICLDYAALMCAQLRSQGIPCKLVVGYAGEVYHAWVNVYTDETGWLTSLIYFDGENWTLMDPTFTSNADGDSSILQYISDGGNYTARYAY